MSYPQISFANTTFPSTGFISKRREVVRSTTLLYQLNVLKTTGRYDAFKLKWHPNVDEPMLVWPIPSWLFWDSDIAKWIEGACYFLQSEKNDDIQKAVTELVEMIRTAQQPDGYLNIHFTVVEPGKRFTNLRDLHELYNAGHLIEAALAHNQLYRNDLFLNPMIKYVELLSKTFGPNAGQKHGYPGHPEIELAILRLYGRTQDPAHLAFARYFINERGNPKGQDGRHYYDFEAEARGDRENEVPGMYPEKRSYWYCQAHKPIDEMKSVEGHAVRAMYLLTAVADLALIEDASSAKYKSTLEVLWNNMAEKKMYLTGGIGAHKQWEGFGIDYFLPSATDEGGCYSETCAGIGVIFLAERLLQLDLDRKYGDIMELCFYNAVSTGMSADGRRFTYVNQLASSDSDLSKREEWFTCACCPPNVTRLYGCIGGYLWTFKVEEDSKSVDINVHLYTSAVLSIPIGDGSIKLEQTTNWPWDGEIKFSLEAPADISRTIRLRIPGWATTWEINPSISHPSIEKGYLTLTTDWLRVNHQFRINIPLKPRLVSPHPYTNQNIVAVARGPIIYCLEDSDNPWVNDHFKSLVFDPQKPITETLTSHPDIGEQYIALTAHDAASFLHIAGVGPQLQEGTVSDEKGVEELHFLPYVLRDNRGGKGHMRVGLRRK